MQQHQHPKTSYDTTLCHAFPVKVGHKLSDILLKPTIVRCASYPPSFLQVSCIQTYRSFSWLITDVSNQAFSWMSSFCHEESQKHTIKTPRMHVDKNRIDAVSTTAVSLPKKLQPVRCKVSLALHLTYCTKSMCSRQMAVQRWPKQITFETMHGPCQTYRSFSWLITEVSNQAFSSISSSWDKRTQQNGKSSQCSNTSIQRPLTTRSLPCLSGKSRAQAKRHLA